MIQNMAVRKTFISEKLSTATKMLQLPAEETIVVVPCFNEASRLPKNKYAEFMQKTSGFGFLFVNDGSSDNTGELLNKLKALAPRKIEVLTLERNSGKAEAVRAGFLEVMTHSKAKFVGFWDADLATPLELLGDYMKVFEEHKQLEMVWGARVKLMGRNIQRRTHRHYLGRMFATCVSLVLNLKIYDTQCGAKIFRITDTLKTIFNTPFKSKWIFDVEILARYLKEKKISQEQAEQLIYELPLPEWRDVAGSKIKPADYLTAFVELINIYLAYR